MRISLGKVVFGLAAVTGMVARVQMSADAATTLSEKPAGTMGSSYPVKQYNAFAKSRSSIKYANSVPDLSEWQGNFTDSQVKKLKGQTPFVILRVQYGSDYYDRTFDHNVALMKKYNVPYGVYSFSQYSSPSDAKTEARDLYKRAPEAKFYVNDYEDQTSSGNTNTAATNWYNTIKPLAGNRKVLLYSYYYFMTLHASKAVNDYDGFWLAAYQNNEPTNAPHVLWQYTDSYYSNALGQSVDASISSSKDSSWFLSGSTNSGNDNGSSNSGSNSNNESKPKPTANVNYTTVKKEFTIKNKPGYDFFNHVPGNGVYAYTRKNYGSAYAGKNITVNSMSTAKDGSGVTYYRSYYKGKNIGWINSNALATKINYKDVNLKVKVKANPASNFYNHVTDSKYTVKRTSKGSAYAGKTLTVNSQGVKYGWKTPYYRCYYKGKLVGWIYKGSVDVIG